MHKLAFVILFRLLKMTAELKKETLGKKGKLVTVE
jgi:hypothetical protein